mgnify:CR=1 FL=1
MPILQFWGRPKVPVILQTEATECGLTCLAMVASYHGYEVDLANLRRRFPVSQKGANLQQLIQIGQQMRYRDQQILPRQHSPIISPSLLAIKV